MKAGLTIEELATEVMRQKDAKADYIVNTSMLAMEHCGTELVLRVLDDSHIDRIEPLDIADTAHRQIGTRLGIPAKYYGKMLTEHPDLLVTNVNAWFEREPTERMLRVLDGKVRAYLSNSYMRMDHYEIFASVLPVIGEIPDVQFVSCHITDNRMYIKAVDPHLTAEVAPGDTVKAGVVISNSEVGLGSVSVQPLIYRELDGNGIAVAGATTKRIHRGRVNSAEEHFMLASQEVLTEADRTFLTELQETVRSATDEEQFSQIVTLMQSAKHHTFLCIEPMRLFAERMEIPNVEWILLGGYGKLKRSWIESVMERKGNIPVFMIGSKLFKDVWRAPLIQEYPPLLYRPAEKTLPHCSECKYCYSVRQGKRGLWRACRHYKIVRQDKDSGGRHIPGRYAAVSPQWCPKRPETNWRFTKRV